MCGLMLMLLVKKLPPLQSVLDVRTSADLGSAGQAVWFLFVLFLKCHPTLWQHAGQYLMTELKSSVPLTQYNNLMNGTKIKFGLH